MQNVFLIGPMGSGKTSLGRRVAPKLGLEFIDLDEELERRCGVEVAVIFDIEGESGFRQRESALLTEIAAGRGQLIATGGGSVLDDENRRVIRASGGVVWLKTSVSQQIRRLERDKRRPLLAAPDRRRRLTGMAKQRNPIYRDLADIVFESRNLSLPRMAASLERTIRILLDRRSDAGQQSERPSRCPSSN
ncbi:MAG: shikimate kinase [Wenzhouxiangellaceae bacterium]|nr:shikimate kinase [Wenzhouxiangellaceae bacterium]